MSDEAIPKSGAAPRTVEGTHYRKGVSLGPIEIMGSTKHGPTTLLSLKTSDVVETGDTVKAKAWLLSFREFVVIRKHDKAMKLAGDWFEVRGIAAKK